MRWDVPGCKEVMKGRRFACSRLEIAEKCGESTGVIGTGIIECNSCETNHDTCALKLRPWVAKPKGRVVAERKVADSEEGR